MLSFVKSLKPLVYLKAVLSNAGEPSFGRFGAAMVIVGTHVWITYIVIKNGVLPDLGGASVFLASGVGACYGITKAGEIKAAKNVSDAASTNLSTTLTSQP